MSAPRTKAIAESALLADVSPESRLAVAEEIMRRAGARPDGGFTTPVLEVVGQLRNDEPFWFSATSTPSISAATPARAGSIADECAAARTRIADERQARAHEIARQGNPWRTGNLTHQAYVSNVDADLARRLMAEAGR